MANIVTLLTHHTRIGCRCGSEHIDIPRETPIEDLDAQYERAGWSVDERTDDLVCRRCSEAAASAGAAPRSGEASLSLRLPVERQAVAA